MNNKAQTLAVADLIRDLKRDSSKWVKAEQSKLPEFHWQQGYGAFSVSPSHVDALKEYTTDEERHHQGETFQDEFRCLCRKYGVEIDHRITNQRNRTYFVSPLRTTTYSNILGARAQDRLSAKKVVISSIPRWLSTRFRHQHHSPFLVVSLPVTTIV